MLAIAGFAIACPVSANAQRIPPIATASAALQSADLLRSSDLERALYAAPTTRDTIGRIIAPVMINGMGPFRFVVDTGATHSAMSKHLAEHLNLAKSTTRTVLLRGVTGSAIVGTVEVARFETGDLVYEGRHMPVIDAMLSGADGVLGAEGLETKRIIVDFVRNSIQITESRGSYARAGYSTVPIEFGFNRLLLADAYIGNVRIKAIIDTGAERTLGNKALRDALGVHDSYFYRPTETGVQGVTAQIQNGDFATAPRIQLANVRLTHVGVTFGDMHVFEVWGLMDEPALLVGMDVLGVMDSIVIDYARKQVQLRPRDAMPQTGSRLIRR